MMRLSGRRRLRVTLLLLLGLVVIAVALGRGTGSRPEADAGYSGTVVVETPSGSVTQRLPISFAVSGSGTAVGAFAFPGGLPRSCSAARVGAVTLVTRNVPVRAPSRIDAALAIRTSSGSREQVGTLELSGLFLSLHRETGAISVTYTGAGRRSCDARGAYSTRADD